VTYVGRAALSRYTARVEAHKLTRWIEPVLLGALFGALAVAERRRPLRRRENPGARRIGRNLALGVAAAGAVGLLERPVVAPLARMVAQRSWGLIPRLPLGDAAKAALCVVLLDYSLYLWHVLLHRVPLLWRCHRPHHADLDLDVTTALRFHVSELALSVPWRALQVVVIGVPPRTLSLWQALTLAEVMFHHSNVRLPVRVESVLCRLIATPRLHGIHHSVIDAERSSNYSSGFTVWDLLHGTARLDVHQQAIVVGLPDLRDRSQVTLARTLVMPGEDPGAVL